MARIAMGGFLHEANTFAPDLATSHEFEKHDGWPGLVRGPGLVDAVAGSNLGVNGFDQAAHAAGQGEILRRVRQVVGVQPPLVASLDFAEGFPPADIFECGPPVVGSTISSCATARPWRRSSAPSPRRGCSRPCGWAMCA